MPSETAARLCAMLPILALAAPLQAQQIEEIVVTADFRERSVADLPASITVFDKAQIEQRAVQHFEELVYSVPNLNWSGDGNRARYFQIRGAGELEQYQGAPNPSVGFLIDDIDFSGIGTVATLFDMQQVEVLRGPQGTRYGANALAGLIYMRSTQPVAEWSANAQVSAADDDMAAAGLAFGGALNSAATVLLRASVHQHQSNGFRDNPFLGKDDTNARDETTIRTRLHWLAGDSWDVNLAVMYADVNNGYDGFAIDNSYTVLSDNPGEDAQESAGASLRAEYAGRDGVLFTSLTTFASSDIRFSFDADWGNTDSWAPVTYDYVSASKRQRKTLSQEFRLTGEQWIAGVYGMRLDDDLETSDQGEYYDPFYDFADSLNAGITSNYQATNVAVFGQYDFALTARTGLSVGLRVERRSADYRDSDGLSASPAETMVGGEISLDHGFSDSLSGYITLSRGYKAGGFNLGVVPDDRREFDAEFMWNLEAGIKSSFANDSVQLNTAVFYARRDDQQVRTSFQIDPGDPTSFVFFTDNAAKGKTLGLEADVRWLPGEAWDVYATLGLLDATFDEFVTPQVDLGGRRQAHAPRTSIAVGARYTHASGLFVRFDWSARSDFYFDVSHDEKSQPYELANLRVGFEADAWTLQAWARNLFDEDYAVRGFYFGNEPPDFPPALYTRYGDPQQVGITLDLRF